MCEAVLRWSPNWVVEPDGGSTLVLSAGADRRVAIDGLDAADRQVVEAWQSSGGSPLPDGSSDGRRQTLTDRLVELGVLVPSSESPTAATTFLGDPEVTDALAGLLPERHSGGLVVAVRTTNDWPDVPAGQLHLGLDLALHHTIVLGPLVVPGASACLHCLDERMAYRWPAPVVPVEPAVVRSLAVAAALLRVQVELVHSGASPLVNTTIAWDLERGTTDRQSVYKMVGCARCDGAAPVGRVNLGWEGS